MLLVINNVRATRKAINVINIVYSVLIKRHRKVSEIRKRENEAF